MQDMTMLEERRALWARQEKYPNTSRGWFLRSLHGRIPNAIEMRGCGLSDNIEYQFNYEQYLKYAYGEHLEIVLTPDIVWFTLLCEVARIVDKSPDAYRDKFTTMPKGDGKGRDKDKTLIKIRTDTPQDLTTYISKIMEMLKGYVPHSLAHRLLTEFTTRTDSSLLACRAVFADMVKHYYEYCGSQGCQGPAYVLPSGDIPRVHVKGTAEDWEKVVDGWEALASIFTGPVGESTVKYLDGVSKTLTELANIVWVLRKEMRPFNEGFLKRIYYEKGNMSTHVTTTGGWFLDLLAPNNLKASDAEPFAQVPYYACYDDGRIEDFVLAAGVFSRRLEGKVLIPEFGHVIFNVPSPKES